MVDAFNFVKITMLALSDAVNPCALAVLTMVLVTLLVQNPKKKRAVLYGGFSFILAVYVGYLLYGLVITKFFISFAEWMRINSRIFYDALGILAMLIGGLQIKDFFFYKPGGFLTEMPLVMRPYAKMLIKKINSPSGAFFIGLLVTIFLLPCTMGPYIIATGILSQFGLIRAGLILLYYNLLFVSPMFFIVGIVYYGFSKVEDVSGWKERNIRKLHLIAGILIFLVGFSLLVGWL